MRYAVIVKNIKVNHLYLMQQHIILQANVPSDSDETENHFQNGAKTAYLLPCLIASFSSTGARSRRKRKATPLTSAHAETVSNVVVNIQSLS